MLYFQLWFLSLLLLLNKYMKAETQLSIHTLYKSFLRLLVWSVFLAEESSLIQLSFFFILLFNFTILYWFCHILT